MPALSKSISNPQRQPPPSLLLGPPSRDSSRISLPAVLLPGAQASSVAAPATSSQRGTSLRSHSTFNPSVQVSGKSTDAVDSPRHSSPPPLGRSSPREERREQEVTTRQKHADRTEALWAEMQMTLEEVELTATNETRLFGAEHAKALEQLRTAQIALAQAWAKSEADEAEEVNPEEIERDSRPTSSDGRGLLSDGKEKITEDETEHDFFLARKRREANDRYFDRVNSGVLDVVAKLEEVASAVRAVEQESRDIWSGSRDSSRSTSIS